MLNINANQAYITQQGLDKLKQELKHLTTVARKEIADRIQEAKELGDLSENAEYAAAKDEQAFLEMKIAELENMIKNAVIINEKLNSNGIVNVGSVVSCRDEQGETKEYKIVGSKEADPLQGKISNESPIGRAFLGKKVNDIVEFQAPKGVVKFTILDIK